MRYNLEQLGYQTVSFATGFAWSELDDADVFLIPSLSSDMSEFETLFLQTTLVRLGQDYGWLDLDELYGQNFRDRHNLIFHSMAKVANMLGAQFVYVHLIMPHPPFVFGQVGSPPTRLTSGMNKRFILLSYSSLVMSIRSFFSTPNCLK